MAYPNKIISNKITGQEIKFIQTAKDTKGELLEMESSFAPHSKEPPAHYHPFQQEDFIVIDGELTVRIDDELRILKAGDHLHIPAKKVHAMWNNSDGKTIVNWKIRPALNIEQLFETVTGLANDNKTNNQGMPSILQAAVLMEHYSNVYRPANPSFIVQKILFGLISFFARLFGYRSSYKKYSE